MDKVAVVLKDKSKLPFMQKLLKKKGLAYVSKNPTLVLTLGGDGTLFFAERKFPGIPKLMIKDSKICNKCVGDNHETILDFVKTNSLIVDEELKIEALFTKKKIIALNDIVIRNKIPNQALRFSLEIDGTKKYEEIIGDGIVISTPFGSSAYFKSITREEFSYGIGIAFNNTIRDYKMIVAGENSKIKIKLLRGDAQIACDNDPKIHILKQGQSISIKKYPKPAKVINIKGYL